MLPTFLNANWLENFYHDLVSFRNLHDIQYSSQFSSMSILIYTYRSLQTVLIRWAHLLFSKRVPRGWKICCVWIFQFSLQSSIHLVFSENSFFSVKKNLHTLAVHRDFTCPLDWLSTRCWLVLQAYHWFQMIYQICCATVVAPGIRKRTHFCLKSAIFS